MGVPALFRWLSRKYPKIILPVVEELPDAQYGRIPQYADPNPNGELDNLYLDMNGIVHPCSHPEHKPAPETEDEMFLDVFKYTERVLMMARPRKVLVIAVDGVAPRAKMNQQRLRRFRAAQDAKVANDEKARQIAEAEARGEAIDDAIKGLRKWDTNAITPGTPFMDGLAAALRWWVAHKLATDPGWAQLQVIVLDATVPGEGEHKLMAFIRAMRLDPEYDPNTRHCIYGLDADLIFLGLATHEPHFRVLREDVFAQGGGHGQGGWNAEARADAKAAGDAADARKPFLWLHVNVLREYLGAELAVRMGMPWDLERAIDDWVFMCFFVGNDFLPHMPALSVRDGGIDTLVGCWKLVVGRLHDYITCDGRLNLDGVEQLLAALAVKEGDILRRRHEQENRYSDKRRHIAPEERALRQKFLPTVSKGHDRAPVRADENMPLMDTKGNVVEGHAALSNREIVAHRATITKANMANEEAAEQLRALLAQKAAGGIPSAELTQQPATQQETSSEIQLDQSQLEPASRSESQMDLASESQPEVGTKRAIELEVDADGDPIRTYEPGYSDRYYAVKFNVQTPEEIARIRSDVIRSYIEGISWVLLYYYQGCPSWQWYYPFHYAPFAADFTNLRDVVGENGVSFTLGQPFRPYEQLMAVLPAASGHTLPEVFRELMSSPDSEIIDFYPENFQIDMNGAKMSWQGIALLPFIDETRLLTAVQAKYALLTDAEAERNTNKSAQLYVSSANKNYERFVAAFNKDEALNFLAHTSGLAGLVQPVSDFSTRGELIFPLKEGDLPNVNKGAFLLAWYEFPKSTTGKSMLLNGYIPHKPVLDEMDKYAVTSRQRNNPRFQNNSDYVNTGPCGDKPFMAYSMRIGGFRALLEGGPNQAKQGRPNNRGPNPGRGTNYNQRGQDHQNYNQNYNQYNQGYNQNQRYNQGYNQGYRDNQGHNGYNLNYNQGYLGYNQGYKQNYGNQGYNQGYNQGNGGYDQGYLNRQGYNKGYGDNYNAGNQGQNYHNNSGNYGNGNAYGNGNDYGNGGYNRGHSQGNGSGYMPPRR